MGGSLRWDTPQQLIASVGGEHIVEFAVTGNEQWHGVVDAALLTAIPGVQSHRVDAGLHQLSVRELHTAVPRIFAALDQPGAAPERVSHPLGHARRCVCGLDGKESAR